MGANNTWIYNIDDSFIDKDKEIYVCNGDGTPLEKGKYLISVYDLDDNNLNEQEFNIE